MEDINLRWKDALEKIAWIKLGHDVSMQPSDLIDFYREKVYDCIYIARRALGIC